MEKENTQKELEKTQEEIRKLQRDLSSDLKKGHFYAVDQKIRNIQKALSLSLRV